MSMCVYIVYVWQNIKYNDKVCVCVLQVKTEKSPKK